LEEQRKYQRFPLTLPVRIEPITSNRKQVFEFRTRDISASGAFVDTTSSFSLGTRIKMNLTGKSQRIKDLTGAQILIECEGNIVRATPKGMAVCFDKECQILSLKGY